MSVLGSNRRKNITRSSKSLRPAIFSGLCLKRVTTHRQTGEYRKLILKGRESGKGSYSAERGKEEREIWRTVSGDMLPKEVFHVFSLSLYLSLSLRSYFSFSRFIFKQLFITSLFPLLPLSSSRFKNTGPAKNYITFDAHVGSFFTLPSYLYADTTRLFRSLFTIVIAIMLLYLVKDFVFCIF